MQKVDHLDVEGEWDSVVAACRSDAHERAVRGVDIDTVPTGAVFYVNDHQASPLVLTSAAGEAISTRTYHPYGTERNSTGDADPHAFVGNERDPGSGLADFRARPYRPEAGIFLAPDPVAVFEPEKTLKAPSRLAPYTYGGGNPIDRRDPSGEYWETLLDLGFLAVDVRTIYEENYVEGRTDTLTQNLVLATVSLAFVLAPGGGADTATNVGIHSAATFAKGGKTVANAGMHTVAGAERAEVASTRAQSAADRSFSSEKQSLVEMAGTDKRAGITPDDMQAYKDLNRTLPDPFPATEVRGPEVHPLRSPQSQPGAGQQPHGHVGPVNHIPITEPTP